MATKKPAYTYTGNHECVLSGGYWYIYLKSSGKLTMTYAKAFAQVCIVGGGGGGNTNGGASTGDSSWGGGEGGKGGQVVNLMNNPLAAGKAYEIVIGTGGAAGGAGSFSKAFETTASGGAAGSETGGKLSGGGKGGSIGTMGTRAFGDDSQLRYGAGGGWGGSSYGCGGGAGGYDAPAGTGVGGTGAHYDRPVTNATAGAPNTGNGGGGNGAAMYWDNGTSYEDGGAAAAGGSGVVIIRGTEDDLIPVFFNNVQLSKIFLNGIEAKGLSYDGVRLFLRRLKGEVQRRWKRRSACTQAGLSWAGGR